MKLFRQRTPTCSSPTRTRFRQVLVDEYQDTNRVQNELVMLLCAEHRNVCIVGDTDQSIYAFRGADIRNILEFEKAFPDAVIIPLEQNYRSTQTILDAANAVIVNNTSRVPKELWTDGERGEPINRYRAEDEYDEAAWVAAEIGRLHHAEGLRYGDVAIFYRTNGQSRALEEALVRTAIAYKVVGGHPLLRPPRGEGHAGLPPGGGQPVRRDLGPAHRERAPAGGGRHLGRPAGRLGPRTGAGPSPTPSTARPRPG